MLIRMLFNLQNPSVYTDAQCSSEITQTDFSRRNESWQNEPIKVHNFITIVKKCRSGACWQ